MWYAVSFLSMSDVMLLWDDPLLFEKLFKEAGLKCQRVLSSSLGTPFLPPCRCVVVPTGFANPAYTKVGKGIESNGKKLEGFVRSGGVLLIFGPLVTKYDYSWLPVELSYVESHGQTGLEVVGDHTACSIVAGDVTVECDGYFSDTDGRVVMKNDDGHPVLVVWELGEGTIIATTLHEFPSVDFLKCVVGGAKKVKV